MNSYTNNTYVEKLILGFQLASKSNIGKLFYLTKELQHIKSIEQTRDGWLPVELYERKDLLTKYLEDLTDGPIQTNNIT